MSAPENRYGDTPTSYPFPAQYRRFFEPLSNGEPTLAIIYEPRGKGNVRGRQAYVGWAALKGAPNRSNTPGLRGEPLWVVTYVGRMVEFPTPVVRDPFGEPIEAWLRDVRPEHRDIRTSGRSVRFLAEDEVRRIVELGYAADISQAPLEYPPGTEVPGLGLAEERSRRLVSALERDAQFRGSVMTAYEYRCAISGFGIGTVPQGRATRLLDAAHIRPVSEKGADVVSNGLALTPSLHRLFDQGLFTIVRRHETVEVVTSPLLEPTMIESADGSFRLPLRTGLRLQIPREAALQPRDSDLRFHATQVFKGPQSTL
jgi:putative restriction endonuclease